MKQKLPIGVIVALPKAADANVAVERRSGLVASKLAS